MKKITVLSLFPSMIDEALQYGIIKRATEKISVESLDLRKWGLGNYHKVDDESFAPGLGMVFRADVLQNAVQDIKTKNSYLVHVSPRGTPLNTQKIKSLFQKDHLIIVASRYEGVDQRFLDHYIDEEISIGDYILSGGELPSLVLIDSLLRYEALEKEAVDNESFQQGLLEYDQYTRPVEFESKTVPDVLRSGNHKLIEETRYYQQLAITWSRRPDIFREYKLCELPEITTKNKLTKIRKQNYLLKKRLAAFEKVIQEYKRCPKKW